MSNMAAYMRARALVHKAAALMDMDEMDITSDDRDPLMAEIRWGIMFVMADEGYGPSQIGRTLLRDQSTVIHGLKRCKSLMGCSYFSGFVEALR